jgi:hypothetical protein
MRRRAYIRRRLLIFVAVTPWSLAIPSPAQVMPQRDERSVTRADLPPDRGQHARRIEATSEMRSKKYRTPQTSAPSENECRDARDAKGHLDIARPAREGGENRGRA